MSDVTELRCWPSCIDALDWSQDGIIALASDERVELLVKFTRNNIALLKVLIHVSFQTQSATTETKKLHSGSTFPCKFRGLRMKNCRSKSQHLW
jgi:hypothetical protein